MTSIRKITNAGPNLKILFFPWLADFIMKRRTVVSFMHVLTARYNAKRFNARF